MSKVSNHVTFSVVSDGAVLPGHDREQVAADLAALMKTAPETAHTIIDRARTLKKGLTQEKAEACKHRLESIGLAIRIDRVEPQGEGSGLTLELEPIDEPQD